MAKSTKSSTTDKKSDSSLEHKKSWVINRQQKLLIGSLLVLFSIALLVAFVSFYIHGQEDQSAVSEFGNRNETVNNWLGKFGAFIANLFIYKGFGLASFLFVKLFFLTGLFLVLDISLQKLKNIWFWDLFAIIILSVLLGFSFTKLPELGGTIGYEMNLFSQAYIGKTGTLLVLLFGALVYLIYKIKISPDAVKSFFEKRKKEIKDDLNNLKNIFKNWTVVLNDGGTALKTAAATWYAAELADVDSDAMQNVKFNLNKVLNIYFSLCFKLVLLCYI